MVSVTVKVRFYETDMMGVVHHTNHLRWFESGRVEYLRKAGIELLDLMANGIIFPIKKISCEYKEPAMFDDFIRVETTLKKLSRAQLVFSYQLVREKDGVLIATGETQSVFTNKATGKIARLPDVYYRALESLMKGD